MSNNTENEKFTFKTGRNAPSEQENNYFCFNNKL